MHMYMRMCKLDAVSEQWVFIVDALALARVGAEGGACARGRCRRGSKWAAERLECLFGAVERRVLIDDRSACVERGRHQKKKHVSGRQACNLGHHQPSPRCIAVSPIDDGDRWCVRLGVRRVRDANEWQRRVVARELQRHQQADEHPESDSSGKQQQSARAKHE